MRKHIGIIGGGFKPFTRGHFFLVEQAADETDKVLLLVSTSNRERKGELPIYWENQMEEVWKLFLEKAMPKNVEVIYVTNPTSATYKILADADADANDTNTYVIYGDIEDIPKYYPDSRLEKYYPRLTENSQIEKRAFSRASHVDISGTKMRNYVVSDDVENFTSGLPEPVQRYGQEIFNILRKNVDKIKQPKIKKSISK